MSGKACHCEEGLAEWIMSYADMITILMAFFVVMYSMAGNKDTAKEQAVLKSLRNQFGPMMPGWGSLIPSITGRQNTSNVDLPYRGGTKERNKNRGGAELRRTPEGDHPRVHAPWPGEQSRVGGVIYFPDEGTTLTDKQEETLKQIATDLGGKPQKIEVRGHTSRRSSVHNSAATDTWDVAYARCRATMENLISLGIEPQRFRLSVAGEHEPVEQAEVPSPHAQNSRVEVFMLNEVVNDQSRKIRPKGFAPPAKSPE